MNSETWATSGCLLHRRELRRLLWACARRVLWAGLRRTLCRRYQSRRVGYRLWEIDLLDHYWTAVRWARRLQSLLFRALVGRREKCQGMVRYRDLAKRVVQVKRDHGVLCPCPGESLAMSCLDEGLDESLAKNYPDGDLVRNCLDWDLARKYLD